MTGSKMTTMALEEMRAAQQRGEDQSDLTAVRQQAAAGMEPVEDEDAPDVSTLLRAEVARRRAGRPAGSGNKEQVAIRLDREILTAFRASGTGWQTRINAALKDWLKTHSPV